jgi:DNA-binding NarL/FixJ family response regulator
VPALLAQETFDRAFLDISMPELDGIELLQIIKDRSPETECIMVTGHQTAGVSIRSVDLVFRRGSAPTGPRRSPTPTHR